MKHEHKGKLNGEHSLFLLLFYSALAVMVPRGAAAYIPKITHAEGHETSIDGELYEDGEIMSCRTPVRYYYYKVLEEGGAAENTECRECAEKWAAEKLPMPDTIRGLIKKVKVANDEETKKLQQKFCGMLNDGRDDIILAYAEALRLNGDLKMFDSVIACYKQCLNSPKWKSIGERAPQKRLEAFDAIKKFVLRPAGEVLFLGTSSARGFGGCMLEHKGIGVVIGSQRFIFYDCIWDTGELQQKVDKIYYGLIDLKKAKIAVDVQKEDALAPEAQVLRKMRTMTVRTEKNARLSKRAAKRAETAADEAQTAAASAASAASAAASAAADAESASANAKKAEFNARLGY